MVSLASCQGNTPTPTPTPTPSSTRTPTAAEQVSALEAAGTIPTLNRAAGMLPNDANTNGVRDDIDNYIALRPFSDPGKRPLTQTARGMQSALTVDIANPNAVNGVALSVTRDIRAVFERIES